MNSNLQLCKTVSFAITFTNNRIDFTFADSSDGRLQGDADSETITEELEDPTVFLRPPRQYRKEDP